MVLLEFFGGLLPLTLAASRSGRAATTYYWEVDADALAVAHSNFPSAFSMGDVTGFSREVAARIVEDHPGAIFVLAAGIPCKDVSLINADRQGAHASRSGLHSVVSSAYDILAALAPGCVRGLYECTQMDPADMEVFNESLGCSPVLVCPSDVAPVSRPRHW